MGKTYLRRYYLRALDQTLKGDPEPEYVANEDESQINLEHVLPVAPGEDWDVDEDIAEATENMLGNMVLMKARKNVDLGNKTFEEKKAAYSESSYLITNQIAEYDKWGIDEIKAKQLKMAEIAKKAWSLDFK